MPVVRDRSRGCDPRLPGTSASAQKAGGTLRVYHRDNPPSASHARGGDDLDGHAVHVGVQQSVRLQPAIQAQQRRRPHARTRDGMGVERGPYQADAEAAPGREVARRQALHQRRREVHLGLADRKGASRAGARTRARPTTVNLKETTTNGDYEVTFQLGRPQPSFMTFLAGRLLARLSLPCLRRATARRSRSAPARSRWSSSSRTTASSWCRNPDYWRPNRPYLDAHRLEDHHQPLDADARLRRRRVRPDLHPGRHDAAAPGYQGSGAADLLRAESRRATRGSCWSTATRRPSTTRRSAAPMLLAIDRKAFIDIISEGNDRIGGVMLPPPEGNLGPVAGATRRRSRATARDVEKNREEGRKHHAGARLRAGQDAQGQGVDAQHPALSRPGRDPDRPSEAGLYRRRARGDRDAASG